MSVDTSIVIRTFNEARHLPRLLDGIAAQTFRDFETIVVDSGSVDETRAVAAERCDRLVELDSHDFTYGFSLNRGIEAAAGRRIAIVSAHVFPADEHWLERLVGALDDQQVALAYGRQLPVPETKLSERREFAQQFGSTRVRQVAPDYYCNNANAAIWRELWLEQPYDESLTGLEDQAWAKVWLDRGWSLVYEPRAAVHHVHEETWQQIERRYYREAYAARRSGLRARPGLVAAAARTAANWLADVAALPRNRRADLRGAYEVSQYRFRQGRGIVRAAVHEYDPDREHQELFFDRGAHEAVVVRGPGVAALERVPLPEVKPNDVLIRVAYVGVCATDIEVLDGRLGYYTDGWATYPIVPGHEYSGTVVRTGAKVENGFAPGDKVVGGCILSCLICKDCLAGNYAACRMRREVGVLNKDGAYAEYVTVPSQHVHRLSAGADLKEHALIEPLAVVWRGLRRVLPADAGRTRCAVVGLGPIGQIAARLLAHEGHAVAVYDRDERRLALVPERVRRRSTSLDDLDDAEVIIEATGSREALDAVLAGMPPGAKVLLLGLPYGETTFSFDELVAFDRALVGSLGSGPDDFRAAIGVLPQLDLSPLTSHVLPLERFDEAWNDQRRRTHVKVLLEVAGNGAA